MKERGLFSFKPSERGLNPGPAITAGSVGLGSVFENLLGGIGGNPGAPKQNPSIAPGWYDQTVRASLVPLEQRDAAEPYNTMLNAMLVDRPGRLAAALSAMREGKTPILFGTTNDFNV